MSKLPLEYPTTDTVIAMGAEARISVGKYLGMSVISKHRFEKKYRSPKIDRTLRKNRTIQETRLLIAAKEAGVNVPFILDVDKKNWVIVMQKIEGESIKYHLDKKTIETFFPSIGEMVAKLHQANIIHGDLTTSNIILAEGKIYLIDFGLGFISGHIEDQGVDILVLKHILESSHPQFHENAFKSFIEGYEKINLKSDQVFKRMTQVEQRVRYKKH